MSNDQGPYGVAIHGAGSVAAAHAASWLQNPRVRIVSVSSRSPETAQAFAMKHRLDCTIHNTLDDVLRDERVHIVDLTGPNYVHAEQGIAVATAGRHIVVEKPIAMSMAENRSLRDAVAKAGVKSLACFVLRWNPLFDNLKSLLAANTVGDLFYAEVDYWHRIGSWYSGWNWAHTRATGGSTMLLAGCHAVDALRWFVGDEAVEVTAYSNNIKKQYEYDANVVAIVRFRNGTIGKTSALFDCDMPYAFNIDLVGTEGVLRDNRLWSKKLLPGQTDWATLPSILPNSGDVQHHPFDAMMNHFVDCIREDRESHCNIADAYHTHELCLAIDRSIEAGGVPVSLPAPLNPKPVAPHEFARTCAPCS
ncbi:MAG: Gfo/Idh/MocA family oxidoreductase [Pirellulales bacterium]|nr:Gfo/Idh/MocA family oxidoreductase [Pirellulales bacterium]